MHLIKPLKLRSNSGLIGLKDHQFQLILTNLESNLITNINISEYLLVWFSRNNLSLASCNNKIKI